MVKQSEAPLDSTMNVHSRFDRLTKRSRRHLITIMESFRRSRYIAVYPKPQLLGRRALLKPSDEIHAEPHDPCQPV